MGRSPIPSRINPLTWEKTLSFFRKLPLVRGFSEACHQGLGAPKEGTKTFPEDLAPPKATERGGFPTPGGPKKTTLSPLCSLLRLQEGDFPRKGGRCVHITGLLLEISWIAGPRGNIRPLSPFPLVGVKRLGTNQGLRVPVRPVHPPGPPGISPPCFPGWESIRRSFRPRFADPSFVSLCEIVSVVLVARLSRFSGERDPPENTPHPLEVDQKRAQRGISPLWDPREHVLAAACVLLWAPGQERPRKGGRS